MPTKNTPSGARPTYIKDLVLLFSIPLAIAFLAGIAVYVPRLSAKPSYDFIYTYCPDYSCTTSYSMTGDGHVQQSKADISGFKPQHAQLRYFDTSANASRVISYDDAQHYTLINSSKSPDGYRLTRGTSDGGFLFWSDGGSTSWYLENGWKKRTVQLVTGQNSYYSNDTTFLGWVQK
ncbi:MAG TPA: hypothetical protein VLE73_03220 [Candidatus Saccharimonadales bacterium]|nr:hypothetical protein [Candidatus Saccharimonadales bacterium]